MQIWPAQITDRIVTESHFGRDNLKCFADRPADINIMVDEAVARNAGAEALVCDDTRITYEAMVARIGTLAAGLRDLGVAQGDRVALVMANCPEFVLSLFAVIRLGAIAVPINVREGTPELAHILNDCGAKVLIHDADLSGHLPGDAELPLLRQRISVGGQAPGALAFEDIGAAGHSADPVPVKEEDTAVILYTSGTTGKPKGAMLTHFNIVHSSMHFELAMELGIGDSSLLCVPASHVTGLIATIFTMLRTAGTIVIMRAFEAEAFLQIIARERVSQTLIVPAMYNLVLLRCDLSAYDLSSWRIGGYGGAPMAASTIAELSEKVPTLNLMNAYGATELTSPATILPIGYGVSRADSVGIPVPCGEIRVRDEAGRDLPRNTPGELWIRGPNVVPGYWNNPEKTAAEFHDGYWKSGDVGSMDEEGFITLHDRRKDMIIRGGYNIYSAEIENTLIAHPSVMECAAIGRADPVLGEKLHVFVQTEDPDLTLEVLRDYCKAHLADYKRPDFATFTRDPLPRNANGKIVKRALREMAG